MTLEFAIKEAQRRATVLGKEYAIYQSLNEPAEHIIRVRDPVALPAGAWRLVRLIKAS